MTIGAGRQILFLVTVRSAVLRCLVKGVLIQITTTQGGWEGGMLGILIYVGDGEAIMKGGRPNLDYVQYSTRFGPCAL